LPLADLLRQPISWPPGWSRSPQRFALNWGQVYLASLAGGPKRKSLPTGWL